MFVGGCSSGESGGGGAQPERTAQQTPTTARQGGVGARSQQGSGKCPVTLNNTRGRPPGEAAPPQGTAGGAYYKEGRLWTSLWPEGTIRERAHNDGSIEMKFPWWRGVRGRLRITGRRLDGATPKLRARIPAGYGPIGFQSTAVIFPTYGCWRVTGRVRRGSLSFVTLVVKPA